MPFGGDDADSYYDEGLTASMKGDWAGAARCFEKALRLERGMAPAQHQLGRCYLRMGDTRRAVELLKRVVENKPTQLQPRLDLGSALLNGGLTSQARDQFEQAVFLDPANGRAHVGLAQVCFSEGRWPAAMAEAQVALNTGGPNFAALYILGRAAKLAGNLALAHSSLEQAEVLVEKSSELGPSQPEGHFLRGEVNFALERFERAVEHYMAAEQRAEINRPYSAYGENFTLLDILGKQALCCQRLNRSDRARELGKRILQADPTHKLGQALRNL